MIKKIFVVITLTFSLCLCNPNNGKIYKITKVYMPNFEQLYYDTIIGDFDEQKFVTDNNSYYIEYDKHFPKRFEATSKNKEITFEDERYLLEKDTSIMYKTDSIRLLLLSWDCNCSSFGYLIVSDKFGLLKSFGEAGGTVLMKMARVGNDKEEVYDIEELLDFIATNGVFFPTQPLPPPILQKE